MRRPGTAVRGDGSTHIRPTSAIVLSALVWALCSATVAQALWVYGASGLRFAELPVAVAIVVWALLWAPRVIVRDHEIEVRNVLVTHRLPMASIADVRLGAMLRFVLEPRSEADDADVITAWNAPGVGKDRPRERISASDPRAAAADSTVRGGGRAASRRRAASDWSQRLVEDQRSSPSFRALEAWQQWERSSDDGVEHADPGAEHADRDAGHAELATRQVNAPVVAGLAVAAALVVIHIIL